MLDFSCQDNLPILCEESRRVLAHANITIIGAGALGSHASELLVRSGATNITIFDDDMVEEKNLHRTLYTKQDVGKEKIRALADRINSLTKATVIIIPKKITQADQLRGADIILDCTDSIKARKIIGTAGIPWVHAAVIQEKGEVMTITKDSKTYEDLIKNIHAQDDCTDQGVLPSAVAMTAALQVTMAIRLITGNPILNCFFRLNAWKGTIERYEL